MLSTMKGSDVVLLTECNTSGVAWSRGLGAYQIASHLRACGYSVQVVDFIGYFSRSELRRLIDKYVGEGTLALCFSISYFNPSTRNIYFNGDLSRSQQLTLMAERLQVIQQDERDATAAYVWPFDLDLLDELIDYARQANPSLKTIMGGAPVEMLSLSDSAMAELEARIDYLIGGYGEDAIVNLLSELRNSGSTVRRPRVSCFEPDAYEFPFVQSRLVWDESDAIFPGEVLPIEISRGCVFKCRFCSFPLNGKTRLDHVKNPDQLFQEFASNFERYGVTSYFFSDDTFNDSNEKLERLYEQVISRLPFKLNFFAYLRLDLVHRFPQQIPLLKKMGIRYAKFGIESLHEKTIRFIGKGFSFEDIKSTLSRLRGEWADDVLIDGSFIFGLPEETRESLDFMCRWLSEDGLDYMNSFSLWPLYIRRASPEVAQRMSPYQLSRLPDISVNCERYGYSFPVPERPSEWWREDIGLGFGDMCNYIHKVDEAVLLHPARRVGEHIGMSLENLGVSFDDLRTVPAAKLLAHERLLSSYLDRVLQYKEIVLQ